ncbi:zinc finger CCCH domain-containing protein 18-like [Dendrobium catenatum]|uniref:zinc finger CCCH domain-containing protein 18-like n=1 Tax=Dendrobium catenatum TaxID=906689 RepID=UPI0009F1EEA2|nr:zinc finger CCCH domain-containing protein 18-like [Dendrobium catenatum]
MKAATISTFTSTSIFPNRGWGRKFPHFRFFFLKTKPNRMNFAELTKIVLERIQIIEQDNFRKIVGFILFNEPSEIEMLQLAFCSENALLFRIDEVKKMLRNLYPKNVSGSSERQFGSFLQGSRSFSFPSVFNIPAEYWDQRISSDKFPYGKNIDFAPRTYPVSTEENYFLSNQNQLFNLDENFCSQDASLDGSSPLRTSKRSPSLPEFPLKPCHYYYKGYCKHGENCRYFHGGPSFPDGHLQAFVPSLNDLQSEDHGFSPASLEKLEIEIIELLRAQRGLPVSIASLPILYYEKYGKYLQAEGYLTESQRHGKAGFSLTKLLARLKNKIRLIDRPHGQHSVILVEPVPKYLDCRNERNELRSTASSSHQIYLTFPAESTFTEDDVSDYFKQFGPVKDVRIPCQEKRMFGFVSFVYPETVSKILMKRVSHYICDSRVLVKPYREKLRMVDRIHTEQIKSPICYPLHCVDFDSEPRALPREFESSSALKMHFEEQDKLLELERMRLSEFNFNYGVDNLKLPGPDEFTLEDHFNYTLEALNIDFSTDDKTRNTSTSCSNLERGQILLPENPFASPQLLATSISTAT